MSSQGFDDAGGTGEAGEGGGTGASRVGGGDEVAWYAAEVRAELADLSAADSAELLEDLEDHLREVAAEDAGVLRQRLGSPAAYARELRESAGLPPRAAGAGAGTGENRTSSRPPRRSLAELVAEAERRIRATTFGTEALDFVPTLLPAWWVLRAWLLVRLLEALTHDSAIWELPIVPPVGGSSALGLILLVAAVVGSVRLARHRTLAGWTRSTLLVTQAFLALFALLIVAKGAGQDSVNPSQVAYSQPQGLSQDGRQLNNLYVYDKSGKLLDGVYIYDQDGNPVEAMNLRGMFFSVPAWDTADGAQLTNLYPLHMSAEVDGPAGGHSVPIPAPSTRAVPRNPQRIVFGDDGSAPHVDPGSPTPSTPTPSTPTPTAGASTPGTLPPTPSATSPSP